MFRNPRVWLYAASGWLALMGLTHAGVHVWVFVLENGVVGQREFAMNAMKQALSTDPLQPSMWRLMQSFSASFSMLLIACGATGLMLAWKRAPADVLRAFSLLSTVVWTAAFGVFVFVHPVIQPIVISAIVVPLYGLAWLTANHEAESGRGPD